MTPNIFYSNLKTSNTPTRLRNGGFTLVDFSIIIYNIEYILFINSYIYCWKKLITKTKIVKIPN